MAAPLSTTGRAVYNALNLRLIELGHAFSPSHLAALTADIMAVVNANNATAVADSATDAVAFQAPPHTKF